MIRSWYLPSTDFCVLPMARSISWESLSTSIGCNSVEQRMAAFTNGFSDSKPHGSVTRRVDWHSTVPINSPILLIAS